MVVLLLLVFAGQSLVDGQTLADCDIGPDATLNLVMQSGVVTYDLVNASTPPLGATNLACLGVDAVMSQTVTGISSGTASSAELDPYSLPYSLPCTAADEGPVP